MNRRPEEMVFQRLVSLVRKCRVPFVIHEHVPTRTMEDAERNLSFDISRIVKTVAFRTRDGQLVLAALRGVRRVDYARLAALLGVNRRDLSALSADEVWYELGVEPGSVSPLPLRDDVKVFIDDDVLAIQPTLYCGIGRADLTLEIAPAHLVRLSGGQTEKFSKNSP